MKLPLDQVRIDGGTQPRAALNFDTVDDYSDAMVDGAKFPAVTVFYDGSEYWLADGFHRLRAAVQADLSEIECDVKQGTRSEAQWFSFGANKVHGLRRNTGDVERAIRAAVEHERGTGLTDGVIAKHVGCSREWVCKIRAKNSSCESSQDSPTRTVTRNGKTYEQNTANIGKSASCSPPRERETPSRRDPGAAGMQQNAAVAERFDADCAESVFRAAKLIRDCPITSKDLALYIERHSQADEIIRLFEVVNEFLAATTKTIRTTSAAK